MRIKLLLSILMLLVIPITIATDICGEEIKPDINCLMTTPVISCTTYNYTIINNTEIIEEGNLTLLNDSIYYFQFNQPIGTYVVRLCDDSTREAEVKHGLGMSYIAIIISYGLYSLLLLYASTLIERKELVIVKLFLFLIAVISVFLLGMYPYIIGLNPDNVSSMAPVTTGLFLANLFLTMAFIYFFVLARFTKLLELIRGMIKKK